MARENRTSFLRDWLLGHKQPQSAATTLIRMKHCGLPMSSREPFAWFAGIIQSARCLCERRTYLATRYSRRRRRKEAAIAYAGGIKALEAAAQHKIMKKQPISPNPSMAQAAPRLRRRLARKYRSDPAQLFSMVKRFLNCLRIEPPS